METGLNAAKPDQFLSKFFKKQKFFANNKWHLLSKFNNVYLIAVGKSSYSMTKFVNSKIRINFGLVVVPQNYHESFHKRNFRVIKAGHPIPNNSSVTAAKSILQVVKKSRKGDLIIFLVSGGASALVSLPYGISLKEKQRLTEILVKSGASIKEINAIRKHLSQVKGGLMLEELNCMAVSYVMSDVVGNDLSAIASGLTYCDNTTFSHCLQIVKQYELEKKIPKRALQHLKLGSEGKISETPKTSKIQNIVVATNDDCLKAMQKKSTHLGYRTSILSSVNGDVQNAAKKIMKTFSSKSKSCLIFGGETTVRVKGNGKGGRNQELVLCLLAALDENIVVTSLGTDGIDGNTKDAGAIFYDIAKETEAKKYLKNNDSNSFFRRYGGLIKTGPTHTNLLDIGLILKS
ncbi:MAG TPA: DUF4147 domain-containing protein [Candidatus Nitrosotenuis sp.]|nr:DUF4147 domain-containing protein [Candidatus Nitrosotenuis sp.]